MVAESEDKLKHQPLLRLYIIHKESLSSRHMHMHTAQSVIRSVAAAKGFKMAPQFMTKHNPDVLDMNAASSRISYTKTGDTLLDGRMHMLGVEELSNLFKHEEAWKRVIMLAEGRPDDLHMVIEDDVVLNDECKDNLMYLIALLAGEKASETVHDIVLCGLNHPKDTRADPLSLLPIAGVVTSKEAYFITRRGAQALVDGMSPVRFSTKDYLSWASRSSGKVNVFGASKRCTIDGSKIGIFPSSIHPNNMLTLNFEYMEMLKIYQNDLQDSDLTENTTVQLMKSIDNLYNHVKKLGSPDVLHLLGAILARIGKKQEAAETLEIACDEIVKRQGLLNSNSELLINAMAIHRDLQHDLRPLMTKGSKFDALPVAL